MKRVFADTSAFFAHLVAEDAHHTAARALFERAARESWTLITTNAVVWETYTLIRVRARNGRELALGFLEDIEDGLCDIERVRPLDEVRAIELLKRHEWPGREEKHVVRHHSLDRADLDRKEVGRRNAFPVA